MRQSNRGKTSLLPLWSLSYALTLEEKFGRVTVQYHLKVITSCWKKTFGPIRSISAPEPAFATTEAHDVVAIACLAGSAVSKQFMQPSGVRPVCDHFWP
jgi:hypothetical protein